MTTEPSAAARPPVDPRNRTPHPTRVGSRSAARLWGWVLLTTILLLSSATALAGAAIIVVDRSQRDGTGFLVDDREYEVNTESIAVTASAEQLFAYETELDVFNEFVGPIAIDVAPRDGSNMFVGLAREADVDRYLTSVWHDELAVTDTGIDASTHQGAKSVAEPGSQDFWAQSLEGERTLKLKTSLDDGDWKVVIMNADAEAGVVADVRAGGRFESLVWVGVGTLSTGLTGLAAAIAGIVAMRRRTARVGMRAA